MNKILYFFLFLAIINVMLFSQENVTKNMILIPAGYFSIGNNNGLNDEVPVVNVWIDSFYIDETAVTNAQYKIFCDSTKRPYPINPPWDTTYFVSKKNYPVIYVSWEDANAFAKWSNKRLPTEAEWEKAAKAGTSTKYFCGDTITGGDANFAGTGENDIWKHTSPVKSFPPNKYGLYGMYGNVWEWCSDYYFKDSYFLITSPNPKGIRTGNEKVIRGGSWDSSLKYLRSTIRGKNSPAKKNSNVGFRCAVSVEKK
jgi:formylglycine-generating enzyme required for sulfatase activity